MNSTKLGKILSLAASDNEAEALRALQAAKRMLGSAGLDFVDVANLVAAPEESGETETVTDLRECLSQLRRENRLLKVESRQLRAGSPTAGQANAREIEVTLRRLATERAERAQSDAACAQLAELADRLELERQTAIDEMARLAAEVRRLTLVATHLSGELELSEHERFRLTAETRKPALAEHSRHSPRRSPRTSESQYRLL